MFFDVCIEQKYGNRQPEVHQKNQRTHLAYIFHDWQLMIRADTNLKKEIGIGPKNGDTPCGGRVIGAASSVRFEMRDQTPQRLHRPMSSAGGVNRVGMICSYSIHLHLHALLHARPSAPARTHERTWCTLQKPSQKMKLFP